MRVRVICRLNRFEQSAEVIEQTPHAFVNQLTQDGDGQVRLPYPATPHQQQTPPIAGIAFDEPVSMIERAKL
jgi:hypothetical protein